MTENFLNKLEKIILQNIEENSFGVSELASETGLSRSQVLRKIKTLTGQSANHFIREIRLKEAIKLIQNTDLTASEIAYKVGFGSPSYFNKCFLDRFEITPGDLKKKTELGVNGSFELPPRTKNFRGKRKFIFAGILAAVFVVMAYSIFTYKSNRNNEQKTSIAVLPFLDLSENKDHEYLSDGITEALTRELSQIKELRVPSRTSSMKYKGEKKLITEIAGELNVNMVLEGSVLHEGDSILITVQLINAKDEEEHLWAESYSMKYENILKLINLISIEIAKNITSVIEPVSVSKKIDRIVPEAYDLFLRGRHIWNTQNINESSLQQAVKYLEEAIGIDPKFPLAYVTLAETYISINTLIGDNEEKMQYREKARIAIDIALELDPMLSETYIAKANLTGKLDWDWERMKSLVARGLELEPGSGAAHLALSNYFVTKGSYEKAIKEALKAEKSDPVNPQVGCFVAERYYIAGDFEKALEKYKEVLSLNPNYGFAYNNIGFVYFMAGNPEKAVEAWQKLQLIMGNKELFNCYNEHPYQDCLQFYLDFAKRNEPRFCSNPVIISLVMMLVNDMAGALDFLEIACKYKNEDLPVMITYPDFHPLHSNPRFQEIARNVGIVFPK